jgi:hypothetical protein
MDLLCLRNLSFIRFRGMGGEGMIVIFLKIELDMIGQRILLVDFRPRISLNNTTELIFLIIVELLSCIFERGFQFMILIALSTNHLSAAHLLTRGTNLLKLILVNYFASLNGCS